MEKKSKIHDYVIKGQLKFPKKADTSKLLLGVFAFVGEKEVANSKVDKEGKYSIAFKFKGESPRVDLKVLPLQLARFAGRLPALQKTVDPKRFKLKKMSSERWFADFEFAIPLEYLERLLIVTTTYRLYGVVWSQHEFFNEEVSGAKIEFYEVDSSLLRRPWWLPTEVLLGEAITGPDGSYEFQFDFTSGGYWQSACYWLFRDDEPDIQVKISQFVDGEWVQVFEGPVDWDIMPDFHRDYFIPAEFVMPIPDSASKPDQGFQFTSIGLLPVDANHISNGYAYAQPGDPSRIAAIHRQPFCGTLRIFGLFAAAEGVETYEVLITEADHNGPLNGNWRSITDALNNRRWNSGTGLWEYRVLGPDDSSRYENIDNEAEDLWHEHALKATWNTVNHPNGYYSLRIVGYDSNNVLKCDVSIQSIRVDNTAPEVAIDVVHSENICGHMTLATDRVMSFQVTAHDSEGHLLRYSLNGTRGREAEAAGSMLNEDGVAVSLMTRPDPDGPWHGLTDETVEFRVYSLSGGLWQCHILAYNFELHVYGSATDGYNVTPSSQHVREEVNLVVSEPP